MAHGWRVAADPHAFYKLPPDAQRDVLALYFADEADQKAAKEDNRAKASVEAFLNTRR